MPEGFVIFDDVFVPNERIFLDGEVAHAAVFAHSLGLWERLGGLSAMADEADQLVGFAQLIAEANGLARRRAHQGEDLRDDHPRDADSRRARGRDRQLPDQPDQGAFPDELYTNAGKYHGAANYNLMVRHLHDIAGGSVLTAPARRRPRERGDRPAGAQVHGAPARASTASTARACSTRSATSPPTPTAAGRRSPTSRPAAASTRSAS